MSLQNALDAAVKLKSALATEVARSQEVRQILKSVNSDALLSQASLREAFNHHSAWLAGELARGLAAWAAPHGLADVTPDDVCRLAPFEGAQLRTILGEIKALSASLSELDAFNQQLAQQALTFVRAYVSHLAPRPAAYTRRGLPAALEAATHSEHA